MAVDLIFRFIKKDIMKIKNIFLLLCVLSIYSCKKDDIAQESPVKQFSALTQQIADNSGIVSTVYSDTVIDVAPGIKETEIHFLDMRGYSTRVFIQSIDLNTPGLSLEVGTPFDLPSYGSSQSMLGMAKYADRPNHRILGAVNSDFYDVSNYIPLGPLIKNGAILKDTFTPLSAFPEQALSFIGILDNGRMYIGYKDEYPQYRSQLTEATGGGVLLMKDNEIVNNPLFTSVQPRIAIGYTDDNIIYFVIVDGRNFYNSNGMTYPYLSNLFKSLNVNSAINLDGGGSSTMVILNPIAKIWQMRNAPSDGHARPVSNGWLVVSDQP